MLDNRENKKISTNGLTKMVELFQKAITFNSMERLSNRFRRLMEYQKIIKMLYNTPNQQIELMTKIE